MKYFKGGSKSIIDREWTILMYINFDKVRNKLKTYREWWIACCVNWKFVVKKNTWKILIRRGCVDC